MFGYIIIISLPYTIIATHENTISVLNCAKQGMLFYPPTRECSLPMVQGMCEEGEMMVLGREGVGECVVNHCMGEKEDLVWTGEECVEMYKQAGCSGRGERMVYNITGGVECVCEEGWGRVGDGCYQHSSPGPCNHTQLVLQSDMPEYCQCTNHLSCPSFMSDLSTLSTFTRHSTQYMAGVARLQAMVCSKPLQQVCCPDNQILAGNFKKGARKNDVSIGPCIGVTSWLVRMAQAKVL